MNLNFPTLQPAAPASALVETAFNFVQTALKDAEGGHDWFHALRVYQNATYIGGREGGDLEVVQLTALLHDVGDSKFHQGDEQIGPAKIGAFLEEQNARPELKLAVLESCERMSFRKNLEQRQELSLEGAIVQDADRLDAIGAIGIGRAFHFGGHKNRLLFDPAVPPNLQMSTETYKKKDGPTINHFFEKLLLLKDQMNTPTGKELAEQRHRFMESFLSQFFNEWNGTI